MSSLMGNNEHLVLMFIKARYTANFKVDNIKDKKY